MEHESSIVAQIRFNEVKKKVSVIVIMGYQIQKEHFGLD